MDPLADVNVGFGLLSHLTSFEEDILISKDPSTAQEILRTSFGEQESPNLRRHITSEGGKGFQKVSQQFLETYSKQRLTPSHYDEGGGTSDVYIRDGVVFRPGPRFISKAEICQTVLKAVGLGDCYPETIKGTVSHVTSYIDDHTTYQLVEDEEGQRYLTDAKSRFQFCSEDVPYIKLSDGSIVMMEQREDGTFQLARGQEMTRTQADRYLEEGFYTRKSSEGVDGLVPTSQLKTAEEESLSKQAIVKFQDGWCFKDRFFPLKDEKQLKPISGQRYCFAKLENSLFRVKRVSEPKQLPDRLADVAADRFVAVTAFEKKVLVPSERCHRVIDSDSGLCVERQGGLYSAVPDKQGKSYSVHGENVEGTIQRKVEKAFQELDLSNRRQSAKVNSFYAQIDPSAFVDAFLAVTLIRHQDAKCSDLEDSNILFEAIESDSTKQLRPVLIDVVESTPERNDVSVDIERTRSFSERCAPVRNGLMAFPQAAKQLSLEETRYVFQRIEQMVAAKPKLEDQLKRISEFSREARESQLEMIDKMRAFVQRHQKSEANSFSLQELFFYLFPVYHEHWKELEKAGRYTAVEIASFVGAQSIETLRRELKL